jgi:predicted CoA-substrate-specific enzyme activase
MKDKVYIGIDLGSSSIKTILIDEKKEIIDIFLHKTTLQLEKDILTVKDKISTICQSDDAFAHVVSTGYGRHRVDFAMESKPEIICHARGVYQSFPFASTVIDIGGQDNKVIQINSDGTVAHFRMNTKCAAGTGSFLEEIAIKADLSLKELHDLAMKSNFTEPINSFCTVFAMTEVIKKIVNGERLEDIARGVYISIAERVREVYKKSENKTIVTGGVIAYNPILRELISNKLAMEILVPEHAQYTGAYGAALIAYDYAHAPLEVESDA